MIVVTAPTGHIGSRVVAGLIHAGRKVRLIAKLPPGVRDRVEVVQGSHGDPSVVERAFVGADALFWLAPPDPRETLDQRRELAPLATSSDTFRRISEEKSISG